MLYSLQYLRGVAALLVVLYHSRGELNDIYAQKNLGNILFNYGYIGVDLFFMISGFVIMLSTEKDSSVRSFIVKRLFRLYPVYLVCLLLCALIFTKPIDINYLKSLFFINLNYEKSAPWFGYSVISTAWTLTYEIIFYCIFSIAMKISWKHRHYISSAIIISSVLILGLVYNHEINVSGYATLNDPGAPWILKLFASPMLLEFIAGMVIYQIYSYAKNHDLKMISTPLLLVSSFAFLFFYMSGYNGGHGLLNCGIYAFMLLLSLSVFETTRQIKFNKVLDWMGDISYSLYLIHTIVISILIKKYIDVPFYNPKLGFSNVILILGVSLFISHILFHAIEEPFRKWARHLVPRGNKIKTSNNDSINING